MEQGLRATATPSFDCDALLAWYEENKRDLPWRRELSPYSVWVSEIMAQQTRIAQLIPYYKSFMEKFPDVQALASATEDEVLSAWAGMGYYSRARHLHAAAKTVMRECGGCFPQTLDGWLALPGVGEYTAGAVMSIAYGAREPAVDGNVLRVYARLTNNAADIRTSAIKKAAAAYIRSVMPYEPDKCSMFSQALMELGALVCVPAKPLCDTCPLAESCISHHEGVERLRPVKSMKKPPKEINVTMLLIIDPDGRVLMRKRTESLLNGMWVYCLLDEPLTLDDAYTYVNSMGYTVRLSKYAGVAAHVFTHRVWRMECYVFYVNENHTPGDYQFIHTDAANELAVPAAMRYYRDYISTQH